MGKKGDFDILNQVKKFLKMGEKDTRGKEGNLGRRNKVSGLAKLMGVCALLIANAVGCVFLDKKIEEDYQRPGIHKDIRNGEWDYKLDMRNGKPWYTGIVFGGGKKEFYDGEIYMGKKSVRELGPGKRQVVELKDGGHYEVVPGEIVIGETPKKEIIKISLGTGRPIIVQKGGKFGYKTIEEEEKKGESEFMKLIWQGLTARGRK